MKISTTLALSAAVLALLFAGFLFFSSHHLQSRKLLQAVTWQHMVTPGELSQPHAFLENNCAACHTRNKGVEAQNCIVCHADNKAVLQRQPTAFHADITGCAGCHLEHQGRVLSTTKMEHIELVRLAIRQMKSGSAQPEFDLGQVKSWLEERPRSVEARATPEEARLNCAFCHQTKDHHRGLFGTDCAQCHSTEKWTIAEFRHPSAVSQSCAQCHQAPPSHYMMHFQMIDQKICGQPNAKVNQCFLCHLTTSWNDIKGIGYYKHH